MRFAALVGVLLIVFGTSVQENGNMATIFGSGNESCGTWIAAKSDHAARYQNIGWLLGYISAYNRFVLAVDEDVAKDRVDGPGLIAWIDTYCAAHPLDQLEPVASRLIEELRRRSSAQ